MPEWSHRQYDDWLATVRMGAGAMAELDETGDEESRHLVACNILVAWAHVSAPDSPVLGQLTDQDRRSAAIARLYAGEAPGGEVM